MEKFDESRGIKFISYAVWWIRQAIIQAISENARTIRLPLNRVNILNVKNLITWIEMFEIIYSNREYKKFLFSRFSDLVKIFLNNNLLYILKSNEDIKNKYINIFKNMILKYHFNNTNLILLKF